MALREGALTLAADRLSITPAAVGQRIRALEDYLGLDLLVRGRSGLQATPELEAALPDLRMAFAALDRVSQSLNFERRAEVHIISDIGFAEQWLLPRLPLFRTLHPTLRFCINGTGDVPSRIGTPDLSIHYGDGPGTPLFTDVFLPVTAPDNLRRVADWNSVQVMEGMPLLHVKPVPDQPSMPGWVEWFERFGLRLTGQARGVHYSNMSLALSAARLNVGFVVTGLALVERDLRDASLVAPFAMDQHLPAPHPYRVRTSPNALNRPPIQRFMSWLTSEAHLTKETILRMTAPHPPTTPPDSVVGRGFTPPPIQSEQPIRRQPLQKP